MSQNDLNKKNYRALKSKVNANDLFSAADISRKSLYLLHEASLKSLDNASSCELLSQKLDEYSNKVIHSNGKSIYTDLLEKRNPELKNQIQFRTDPSSLENLDLASFMKDLDCKNAGNKLYCRDSESVTDAEFSDFVSLYNTVKKQTIKKHAVFNQPYGQDTPNLNKTDLFTSSQYTLKTNPVRDRTNSNKKSSDYTNHFRTAKEELDDQALSKYGANSNNYEGETFLQRPKKVGLARRTVKSKFVSPLLSRNESSEDQVKAPDASEVQDERLKNIEPKMVELIRAEIMDPGSNVDWDDIAGLKQAKMAIQEAVVWPLLRPDIFTGLRRPPRGILLFGPPGTGKTLIAKCVASQSKSTFFSISASSLTSKWIGDGEKMVRALFAVARVHQPAVIFIDEVDSLLTQRSDTEHESSRRIKTEFLVHLDGAATNNEDRILLIGATNRPQELDEAARRRFVKRLYIPLPECEARLQLLKRLINNEKHCLAKDEFKQIADMLDGYSGADIQNFCSEASLEPIRCIDFGLIEKIQAHEVRPLHMEDFEKAFKKIRPSVSQDDLAQYIVWNNTYGSGPH